MLNVRVQFETDRRRVRVSGLDPESNTELAWVVEYQREPASDRTATLRLRGLETAAKQNRVAEYAKARKAIVHV